jgi:hypothetical protein
MNKAMLESKTQYPKVVLWWKDRNGESEIQMHDATLKQAYERAVFFGYQPPVWYKPWKYFTGGIGVMTVGMGTQGE